MNIKHLMLFVFSTIAPLNLHTMDQSKELSLGILIAIEGIDGSGKTTLAQRMYETFTQKGFSTLLTREPGDSELGKKIREIVQTQVAPISSPAEFLLFAADRAEHCTKVITPALAAKRLIISDRLADSSLAYQGYGRGLDCNVLTTINRWAMDNVRPHLTVFICVPVETALERCRKRASLSAFEQKDFLNKVAVGFNELYKNRDDVIVVDGKESPELLNTYVCNAIEEWLEANEFCS